MMYQACGRSDDTRMSSISDLCKPIDLHTVGPAAAKLFVMVLKGGNGKTDKNGRPSYMGFIRHKDWELCAASALAEWLFFRFTLLRRPFPDPVEEWEKFVKWPLFPGRKEDTAITYDTQNAYSKDLFIGCLVFISRVCHAMRAAIAQHLDIMGLPSRPL
eukprot:CAMPEP_0202908204 /NCGR_PEP_ID=MMETSP1392-20130828/45251_1 /ASSEMBLY_ACC=CAM_ASM_000868 /TAXON_ID=225041 /ORGANISM="Chlamydomonas chlamydogama, Strain SAG 11-48b" /LENGTH=158 /DNA_ID=CAMNT_0049597413 /DNA_START=19 /DNA_END=496 /DNA_ORIENTATION=-